jgi:cobalt/nickel transport system ATP-binding protein
MLLHIVGILQPTKGEVTVFGRTPTRDALHGKVAMVFQDVDEQIIGPTVWDDIAFSPLNYGHRPEEVEDMVNNIIKELDIQHLANRVPHYLSGGEKKKVAIAGALVTHPRLLVLDEPMAGLDAKSRTEIIGLLNRLNRERNISIVVTTHEVDLVPRVADTVYVISDGAIIFKGTPAELFQQPEVLRKANLEPPPLTELLEALRNEGFEVEVSDDLVEAKRQILKICRPKG